MKDKLLAQAIDFGSLYQKLEKEYGLEFKLPTKPTKTPFTQAKLGDIISSLLPYIFIIAGLILFAYLIISGFGLLTSAGDPKAIESAKGKITHAIVGFIIIFASYWLAQILEIVFGISILG